MNKKIIFTSILLLFSFASHSYNDDHLAEWNNLAPHERQEKTKEALYQTLDPKLTRLLEENNISILDYDSTPVWINERGDYLLSDPNVEVSPLVSIKNNFLNTFKGARLFYNISHENVSVCIDKNLSSCSNKPFRNNRGDFYIRNLDINDRGDYIFHIEVDRNIFYINSINLLSNFDFMSFYEMPSRYKDDLNEQVNHFIGGLVNHSYFVNIAMIRSCVVNGVNTISVRYCDPINSSEIPRESNLTVNSIDGESINFSYNNLRYKMGIDEFIRINSRGIIIRKTY